MSDFAHDYEAGVLLRLLQDSSAIAQCDLTPEEFDNPNYREIYQAIETLNNRQETVSPLTVCDYLLEKTGRNWLPLIAKIHDSLHSPSGLEMYIRVIRSSNLKRKARGVAQNLIENSHITGSIDEAIRALMELMTPQQRHEYDMASAMKLGVDKIDEVEQGKSPGISTGLIDLDAKLGGLHGGDLVVIGARPAVGKTALLINMLLAASKDFPCGVFSGEQDVVQLAHRMIAIEGKVSLMRMRNGKMFDQDWRNLSNAVSALKDRKIDIDDTPSPSLAHIVRTARRWKYSHGLKALYVDYLQRMQIDKKVRRHEAVGENARGLKLLARELDIPIIVLAQVSRDVESRSDKRPNMGDLSDSSEVEKEADQVFMLYRDEVYNPDTSDKGIAEILIDKNRHGPTGFVKTAWHGEWLRFENLVKQGDIL